MPGKSECGDGEHDSRAHWRRTSAKGAPVVGISVCSFCRQKATKADFLYWKELPETVRCHLLLNPDASAA